MRTMRSVPPLTAPLRSRLGSRCRAATVRERCSKIRLATALLCEVVFCAAASAGPDLRLIQAVRNNDKESVQALLKQRADVNLAQGDGATALHWASRNDNLAMADLLLRAGARVNAAND